MHTHRSSFVTAVVGGAEKGPVMSRLLTSASTSRSHRAPRGIGDRLLRGLAVLVAMLVATPDLTPGCGLDVVLVLDASGSIGDVSGAVQNVKDASKTFLDAFQDTNTRVGIVTFNTTASAVVPLTTVTAATNSGSGVHN